MVKESYYVSGNPIENDKLYAAYTKEYDEFGNVISESYYDTYGELTASKNGYAVIKREYNEYRQMIKEYYLDESGKITYC